MVPFLIYLKAFKTQDQTWGGKAQGGKLIKIQFFTTKFRPSVAQLF